MTKARTVLLLGLAILMSCTSDRAPRTAVPRASATAAPMGGLPTGLATPGDAAPVPNADRQQPLGRLGPCARAPTQTSDEVVRGLVLPADAVLTQVTAAEPLTNTQGYVPMTPVQVRAFYQQHPDVTVISVEDEVFEAEILYEADDRRVFVKSQAVCELGSVFVAVVSPTTP